MRNIYLILIFNLLIINFLNAQDSIRRNEFTPDLDGILKTKFEYDTENDLNRFSVRNARFGAKGQVNNYISYRAEVDLSDEGKIKMLDAFVKYTPLKGLDIYLGQRKIPFGTDYLRSPADNMFANRSFVAKYVNDGLRDIGVVISYKSTIKIPFEIWAAALNGTGSNNPQWKEKPNLGGRLVLGPVYGLSVKGNLYTGETDNQINLNILGGELSYASKNFLIESEFVSKSWSDTLSSDFESQGLYIHTFYQFKLKSEKIKYIMPTMRYDVMGKTIAISGKTTERFTVGVNFGLEPKKFISEIRFNYEHYYKSSLSNHTNKFTIEFIARF